MGRPPSSGYSASANDAASASSTTKASRNLASVSSSSDAKMTLAPVGSNVEKNGSAVSGSTAVVNGAASQLADGALTSSEPAAAVPLNIKRRWGKSKDCC